MPTRDLRRVHHVLPATSSHAWNLPGAPFSLAALLLVVALLVSLRIARPVRAEVVGVEAPPGRLF